MPDITHLLNTKQYWVAAWKVIDARPLLGERKPIKEVDDIVRRAIKDQVHEELSKIMRDFSAYVGEDVAAEAYGFLNESTQIDLRPDEL